MNHPIYRGRVNAIISRLQALRIEREQLDRDRIPAWIEPGHHPVVPTRLAKLCSTAWMLIKRWRSGLAADLAKIKGGRAQW